MKARHSMIMSRSLGATKPSNGYDGDDYIQLAADEGSGYGGDGR